MSTEEIKGEIEIVYNDDEVVKGSKETSSSIGALSKNIKSDMSKIGKSADDAADDLGNMGNKGKKSFKKVERGADDAKTSVKNTALEVVALGETFTSVAESVFAFEEKLLSVARAEFGLRDTAIGLEDQILDFNQAMKEGTLTIDDQTKAIRDIRKEYGNMILEQKELDAQQQALNGEFVGFGFTLIQTASLTAIMIKQLDLTKISALANSKVFKVLRFDLAGASLAMKGATFSLTGLRMGIRATTLALGPIGLVILAISAGFAIWESNAFGIQEKLAELFETIQTLFPPIRALAELVATIFPPAEVFDETKVSIEDITTAAGIAAGNLSIMNEITGQTTEEMTGLAAATQLATTKNEQFNKSVKSGTDNLKTQNEVLDDNKKKNNELAQQQALNFGTRQGPGPAPGTKERLAAAKAFRHSLAGIIGQALHGNGGFDRTQSGIAQRNQATLNAIVSPIREARARGLPLPPLESETVAGYSKLAAAARAAIEKRDEEIFQERVSSFDIISRQLGVSATELVTRNREQTISTFAGLIDESTTGITEQQARLFLARGVDDQSTTNSRNALAHRLAYLNRQQMIQNLP